MSAKLTVRGDDSKCPICGTEERCYDGLREGSETPCCGCGATMTVVGASWCAFSLGFVPVFAVEVSVTDTMLKCLRRCATVPQVPVNGRERLTFEALKRRGLVDHCGAFVGYEAKMDVAHQLRSLAGAQ